MTIGERLTKIRKDNGLSQEAFGFELGVSRQAISKWESGSAIPDVDKLIAISKKYGVSVGWILGTEEETGPVSPDLSGDRVDSQVCNIIYGEYSSSIPKIWGYGLGDIWAETLTDINKGYVHEHIDVEVENPRIDYYGNIVTTEKVEYRVYVNRELKNTYTAETLSEEESPSRGNESVWFRLNFDFTHQLKEGDEVIYAAYLTDNYGREQYAITDCYRITDGKAELDSAAWEELTDSKIVVG